METQDHAKHQDFKPTLSLNKSLFNPEYLVSAEILQNPHGQKVSKAASMFFINLYQFKFSDACFMNDFLKFRRESISSQHKPINHHQIV